MKSERESERELNQTLYPTWEHHLALTGAEAEETPAICFPFPFLSCPPMPFFLNQDDIHSKFVTTSTEKN